jgi:putative hydroxymethylpyrimidine transport system permease protein
MRGATTVVGVIVVWQIVVLATGVEHYILPAPGAVASAAFESAGLIARHAVVTVIEILLGLGFGVTIGAASALVISYFAPARRWLLPLLVVSQAIPVFAIAPLLVLWLGYGLASKVAMASLIIYFPVTTSFLDGLRHTERGWIDLARTMTAGAPGARWASLRHIRIPAALPALASGIRVATAVAPIGAVVGEWVGSSAGLGYLMLHANARVQIDLMFAALLVLAAFAVTLYLTVDVLLRRALPWQPETLPTDSEI